MVIDKITERENKALSYKSDLQYLKLYVQSKNLSHRLRNQVFMVKVYSQPLDWFARTPYKIPKTGHNSERLNVTLAGFLNFERKHDIGEITKLAATLYAALSKVAKIMATVLTADAAANIGAPYERIMSALPTCPYPDKWSVKWLHGFTEPTSQYAYPL
ncbi:hypothetical protein TNCV_2892391 [Trichonephila clavipes]|nr:hypothetical protein TNCV_2892391 [Trichonephila clavipes]